MIPVSSLFWYILQLIRISFTLGLCSTYILTKHPSPASPSAKTSAEKQLASITKPSSPTHFPAAESHQALSPPPNSTTKAPTITKHQNDIPAKVSYVPTKELSPNLSTADTVGISHTSHIISLHNPDYPMLPSNFISASSHLNQTCWSLFSWGYHYWSTSSSSSIEDQICVCWKGWKYVFFNISMELANPLPSVQICVRYEDNIVTKCYLGHPSRCLVDYTLYMM